VRVVEAAGVSETGLGTRTLLAVDGLRTHFHLPSGTVHAVNGVSFTVEEGMLVGLVGETGCGKSVTARSIIGLVRPPGRIVDGEVRFRGTDLRQLRKNAMRKLRGGEIAFVPQNPWGSLNPILSLERQFRNVIRAHLGRLSHKECREMALVMLRNVGIQGPERVLTGYAHELSGGMAQRAVIALSFIANPSLVIADEPTTGLDVTIQRQILDLIMQQLELENRAMLLVTHDLGIVAQYCHRVIVMYAGKIVESGPVADVFHAPAHPYTYALLGAIPRKGHELVRLQGGLPSLIHYPAGCAFRDRCEYEHDLAGTVEPELRELTPGHFVACHLSRGVTDHVARSR
jgi:peptide/nickel transport system ATP-binding protein